MALCALAPLLITLFFVNVECHPLIIKQDGPKSTPPKQIFRTHTFYSTPDGPEAKISCSLPSWFNESAYGKPDVRWENNTGNILEINPKQTETGTIFKCVARNLDEKPFVGWDDTEFKFIKSAPEVKLTPPTKTVIGNYSTAGKSEPLVLVCELEKSPVSWFLDHRRLTEATHKHVQIHINNTLVVNSPSYPDVGVYMCVADEDAKMLAFYSIEGAPFFAMKHGKDEDSENKLEGDSVLINHELFGNPLPTELKWSTQKNVDEAVTEITESDFKTKPRLQFYPDFNVTNGVLELTNLEKDDRAYYIATALNKHGNSTFTTLVRVKGKLDALWPFLGIVAEVAILVAIILIYERRRKKHDREVDEAMDQKKPLTSTNNDSVRQRKV